MKKRDGGESNHELPLIGYRMFGTPCALCGLPMEGLWLFKERGMEIWHIGSPLRCSSPYVAPDLSKEQSVPEKKPDGRKAPRTYGTCHYCGTRFVQKPHELSGEVHYLCKACRNQQGLFSDDEITRLQNSVSVDPK